MLKEKQSFPKPPAGSLQGRHSVNFFLFSYPSPQNTYRPHLSKAKPLPWSFFPSLSNNPAALTVLTNKPLPQQDHTLWSKSQSTV